MINIVFAIIVSFSVSLLLLPIIIRITNLKELHVPTSYRMTHKGNVSSFGGIAVVLSAFIAFLIFEDSINYLKIKYLFSAFTIMFLIGIRDDLKPVNAYYKLLGQLLVAGVLVIVCDYRIYGLDGLFGIYNLNQISSYIVSIFLVLMILNSYNFIDGIDLQAGIAAIIYLSILGIWFIINNQNDYALLSFSLVSSLMGFLLYNFPPSKIFLGDTGTMVIGLILAFISIRFINLNNNESILINISNSPLVLFGCFSLFIFDMFRVAITRIYKGINPFNADKNHIHHLLLKLGWKQLSIALFTNSIFIFLIISNFILQHIGTNPNIHFLYILIFNSLLFFILIRKVKAIKKLPN